MILNLINKYKEQYKDLIINDGGGVKSRGNFRFGPQTSFIQGMLSNWHSLKTFQDNWNPDVRDFKSMYESSFANTLSNDLWEGQSFFPKKAMLTFIERDADLVRSMFQELFNENLDIEGRIDRFVYHCDEISRDIMRTNPQYQSHYHEGYRMISVYLAFRYPMQYTIYSYPEYKAFMALIKAQPAPEANEIGRFFKVMRTVNSIIRKDEELLASQYALLEGREELYPGDSLLLVRGFYWFCGFNSPPTPPL